MDLESCMSCDPDVLEQISNGNYVETFNEELPFDYSDEFLLGVADKNKLTKNINDFNLGHYFGYDGIKAFIKSKMVKQIPGPSKNQINEVLISDLRKGNYDGEKLDAVLTRDKKRTIGDSFKTYEYIRDSCERYLNSDKIHTLPKYNEPIYELDIGRKNFYREILISNKEELHTRAQIDNFLSEKTDDFDRKYLDAIIKLYIDEILSV